MKKIHIITLVIISIFRINAINAQIVPCAAINVEAFPKNPQAGLYNYFGVRVTLAQTYDQDITVNGYIYDEGDPNNDHPYSLTVTAGNLSAETDDNFYQTSPANNAALDISSITR